VQPGRRVAISLKNTYFSGEEIFLFSTESIPALGDTQPPIQLVPGALSPGIKQPRREADHLPLSSAKVKSDEAITTSTSPYVFMAWCLIN
jgi:hypothetical protein